jgi:hypothetical protein
MNWLRWSEVVLGAGVLSGLTDWVFAGDWIHTRFSYPEIWRKVPEPGAVTIVTVLPFITAAAFTILAWRLGVEGVRNCSKFALALWVIGPMPLILAHAAFIKLHRVFVGLYLTAWLVKLMIIAVATGRFLH